MLPREAWTVAARRFCITYCSACVAQAVTLWEPVLHAGAVRALPLFRARSSKPTSNPLAPRVKMSPRAVLKPGAWLRTLVGDGDPPLLQRHHGGAGAIPSA